MQIDWLTVAAQIINFLVLVWLLQRFLYKPITDAMRQREEHIADRLAQAKSAREVAEEEAGRLQQRQVALEESRDEVLAEARRDAEKLRARIEAEIRDEMEDKRAAWRGHLAEERDAFVASLRHNAGRKVLEISRRIVADYAGSDLSERVIATFVHRLETLDPDTCAKMTEAAAEEGAHAVVHTGAAIDGAAQDRITTILHETLSTDLDVTFHEDPEMVLGARLTIGDYSAEWSAARYLDRLDTELADIIDAGSRARSDLRDSRRDVSRRTA